MAPVNITAGKAAGENGEIWDNRGENGRVGRSELGV